MRDSLERRDAARHELELCALCEENSESHKLLIHLSKLVIWNVLEGKC